MRGIVIILVNGILTIPGDAKDWNSRGVTHINTHNFEMGFCADLCQYFCGPIGRAFWQRRREKKLANLIKKYLGKRDIVIAAHSNGCDVALGALQRLGWPKILALHLFSAATESDFRHNGLNHAISLRRIGEVYNYVAGRDCWLRLARWPIGELLGYDGKWHWHNLFSFKGALGYAGPMNVTHDAEKHLHRRYEPYFGHSTWWSEKHFAESMRRITLPNSA
jgi:hypothetical protein